MGLSAGSSLGSGTSDVLTVDCSLSRRRFPWQVICDAPVLLLDLHRASVFLVCFPWSTYEISPRPHPPRRPQYVLFRPASHTRPAHPLLSHRAHPPGICVSVYGERGWPWDPAPGRLWTAACSVQSSQRVTRSPPRRAPHQHSSSTYAARLFFPCASQRSCP